MFEIHNYELEALIDWHTEQKWECANKEDYLAADDHKKRIDYIRNELKQREIVKQFDTVSLSDFSDE